MILTACKEAVWYRMHIPRFASTPKSGAGAATFGGRANRPGINTLYLSRDTQTAIEEYRQQSSLMPPGTLVAYELHVQPVVDFTRGYDPKAWQPIWEDFMCDWRRLWFNEHIEPPSWVAADAARHAGAKGILFPSTMNPGGVNLALYVDRIQPTDKLTPHDPQGNLPQNQKSWEG